MILFVDDVKEPKWFDLPEDTPRALTPKDCIRLWASGGYDILYLDHDLGEGMDGSQLLTKLCTDYKKPDKVFCISLNTVGIKRIQSVCGDFDIPFEYIGKMLNNFIMKV
jgi:hypothetical protein